MKRWLPIALAVAAALALAAALVPSGFEQAFMQLRDQDFPKATDSFSKRWMSGDHSREVANALSELLVRKGEPARAADILRQYVGEHPDDRSALSRLAEIFRDDQQRNAYIATMETLWQKDKRTDVLRCLVALYDDAGRDDDQMRALSTLVRTKDATVGDFEALAKLQSTRDPKLALQTLFNAFRRWLGKVSADTAQGFAVLAAEQDRKDLIQSTLLPWFASQTSYASIDPVANALVLAQLDQFALDGVLKSAALAKSDPMTVTLAARLETKLGHWKEAAERLKRLYTAKTLPPSGRDIFLQAAMRTDQRRLAKDVLLEQGPETFPSWLQAWTISYALELGARDFLQDMKTQLDQAARPHAIFFRARVELALGNQARAEELAAIAEKAAANPSDGIAVAGLLVDLGKTDAAQVLLSKYASDAAAVAPDDLMPATEVALGVKEAKLSMALAEQLQKLQRGEQADIVYARALGLNGQARKALELLDAMDHWTDAREVATFEVLKEAGLSDRLQTLLFERMGADTATVAQRTNYTFMLNDFKDLGAKAPQPAIDAVVDDLDDDEITGAPRLARIELLGKLAPARALPYARTVAAADPEHAAYVLLALLRKMGQTDEAISFIASAMPKVNAKTQQSLMYDWISLGVTTPALEWLKTFAEGADRQWFFAYDEALQKMGARARRVEFLSTYATRPDIDGKFRNELASELLEAGAKDAAINLFRTIAADATPRSEAVEQLLFLWGPRPPAEAITWMTDRAMRSPVADRTGWLDRLVEADAPADAARLGSDWYAQGDRSVAPELATAFSMLKSKYELRNLATLELKAGGISSTSAAKLAAAAEDLDLPHEASVLYEIAAKADVKYLAAAGRNAWYGGEQKRARGLLEKAVAVPKPEAATVFLLAEAVSAAHETAQAQKLYEQCLALASVSKDPAAMRTQMMALVRLHRIDDAERLVAKSSDPALQQDYASALLDDGNVARASRILATQRRH